MTPLQCLAFWPEANYKRWQDLETKFNKNSWWEAGTQAADSLKWSDATKQSFRTWRRTATSERFEEQLHKNKITLITYQDSEYPACLSELKPPPLALFVRGKLINALRLAAVGTRKPTDYGRQATRILIPPLAQTGLTIVSGLAYGLDTLVHTLTLGVGGGTVAVLGTGVDTYTIQPTGNQALAERIIANDGAVISEFPPGTPGSKYTFPLRNRIIAGLCDVTLVLEAPMKSGALITADCASQINRAVACVPHPITSIIGAGNNHWLSTEGALIATTPDDILLQYPGLHQNKSQSKLVIEPRLQPLLNLIPKNGQHINEIIHAASQPITQVMSMISELELLGAITDLGGQHYARS